MSKTILHHEAILFVWLFAFCTHAMQWAAVITQLAATRVAPQACM